MLFAGCASGTAPQARSHLPLSSCPETPTISYVISGETLVGKHGGDIFIPLSGPYGAPYVLHSVPKLEKMIVVLDHPILDNPPNELDVHANNLSTGSQRVFRTGRHNSEFGIGVEWGTNFDFPDPGCWELTVDAPANHGVVVVVVE
jgi:hypothetical protein